MNKKTFITKIFWIPETEGGRKSIPAIGNQMYLPFIDFENHEMIWSVYVVNYKMLDSYTSLAEVRYLNQKVAPDDIFVGLKFNLREGNRKVASGEVLSLKTDV